MVEETKEKLDKYYGTFSSSNTIVKGWMQEFRYGRTSTNDKLHSG